MTTELRAAAARLRACHKLAGGKLDVARVYSGDDHSIIADAETLALAWLAEHREDDGEPIDIDWANSLRREGETVANNRQSIARNSQHANRR